MAQKEQKVDYEIIHSLNSLLEFELQETLKEKDFQTYKGKSKALLSKLLLKLEDNFEYQKYLEHEVIRLEEAADCALRIGVQSYDEKNAEIIATSNNKLKQVIDDKDSEIMQLKQELQQSRRDFSELKNVREKEMQTVAVVCSALTDRIKELNGNFSGGTEDETDEVEEIAVELDVEQI